MLYDPKWEVEAPVKLEPWRQQLLDAAQYIRDHGWVQGCIRRGERVCAIGAIYGAVGIIQPLPENNPSVENALNWFRYALGNVPIDLWNDAPGRTKEDVIAALEGAAHQK